MNDLARILVAPALWLASFSAIYGLHGLGCALRWPDTGLAGVSVFRGALLAAWLTAVLVQIVLILALRSDCIGSGSAFTRWTSIATAWVGLTATLWTLYPVALISSCG